ncbi:MAG: carbohydrate-binding domain-containing protein [Bacteroidales bacterium]|nr:carbohydrate-binding domain-containing protein [Bacteroidales bacterium]
MKKAIAALALVAALIAAILLFSNRYQTAEDIYIVWQGERVRIKGEGSGGLKWIISRGALTMTANETVGKQLKLHLSGECVNGSFELTAEKRTQILLEGLYLNNPLGTALSFKGSKSTILTLADDTENTLGDAGIEASGDLTIGGDGSLTIIAQGTGHKGINIDGNLKIKDDPTLTITTSGQPERMQLLPESVWLGKGHGLPPNVSEGDRLPPPPPGFVRYDFSGTAKAIKAQGTILIEGGNITLSTCTPGAEGLESKRDIIINGGILNVDAYDDAINALMTMTVNGGIVNAKSSHNDGIDINGGQLKPWATSIPKNFDPQRAKELAGQPTYFQTGGSVTARTTAGPPEEGLDTDHVPISHTGGELNILDK